jgi:hypothetical protein
MQAFLDYTIMKGNNMLNIVPVGKGACNRSGRRANMGVALHELDATNRDLGRYATITRQRRPRNPAWTWLEEASLQCRTAPSHILYRRQANGVSSFTFCCSWDLSVWQLQSNHVSIFHVITFAIYLALAIRAIPLLLSYLNYITYNRIYYNTELSHLAWALF